MSWVDRLFFGALLVLTLTAVMAFGGATPLIRAGVQSAIFGVWCLRSLQKAVNGDRFFLPGLSFPAMGMALWAWAQSCLGLQATQADSLYGLLYWAQVAAFLLLATDVLAIDGAADQFRNVLLWFTTGLAIAAVVSHQIAASRMWGMLDVPGSRPMGPFVNPNHFAALVGLVLPIALWKAAANGGNPMVLVAVAALASSVVISASRAGVALITVELFVVPWMSVRRRARSFASRLTTLWLCAAGGIAVTGWNVLTRRLQEQNPFRFRPDIFRSTLEMWRDSIWSGVGLGGFETVYPAYARFDTRLRVDHAHNDWLEWVAEGGLPAAVCLVVFLAMSVRTLRGRPWAWGVCAVFVHAAVDFPLQVPGVLLPTLGLAATAWPGRPSGANRHRGVRDSVIWYRWPFHRINKPPPLTALDAGQRPSWRFLGKSLNAVPEATSGSSHSSLAK